MDFTGLTQNRLTAYRRLPGFETFVFMILNTIPSARLRAAGVTFEDRQDLLGHRSGRITTHYSQAELTNLIEAAEKVCDTDSRKSPATTWLRRKAG